MENMKKFLVVSFPKEGTVEIIPSSWMLDNNTCLWPPANEKINLDNMIRKCQPPQSTWHPTQVRIFGGSNSYVTANEKCDAAKYSSHVGSDSSDTDFNKKRRRNKPLRYQNDEDNSESLLKNMSSIQNKTIPPHTEFSLPEPPLGNYTTNRYGENSNIVPPTNNIELSSKIVNETRVQEENFELTQCSQESELSFLQTGATPEEYTTLQKILKYVIDIKQEQKNIKREIRLLREKVDMQLQVENPAALAEISNIVTVEFPSVPVITIDSLNNLEKLITGEPSKASSLARFLCRGSGYNNVNALTLVVMKRLMSREVATQFSLEGRQGKRKFSELNLFNVVIASIKIKFPDAETNAVTSRIGKVLAGSSDWDGNRVRGKRKSKEEKDIIINYDDDDEDDANV